MPNGLKIRLDNQNGERTDGMVLVFCDDVEGAEDDQTIAGSSWEVHAGTLAYTIVSDAVDLVSDLKEEGYDVDQTDYLPPDDECHALYQDGPFGKEPTDY